MIRYLTSGESHGICIASIIDGFPAGINISDFIINEELSKRQKTYGRGARMKIEEDKIKIKSGIRFGETLGSPILLEIENKDWSNWESIMSITPSDQKTKHAVLKPRPGHADLAGVLKYDRLDTRDIFERASARETAIRVAVGSICKQFLSNFGIKIYSYTKEIGKVYYKSKNLQDEEMIKQIEKSPVRCPSETISKAMIKEIDLAISQGDTLGGIFSVIIVGTPVGLGSYTQWDKKLDARLAYAILSIQSVKGVEFGTGFELGKKRGSVVGDEIMYSKERGFFRKTNNGGGIEGGMSNGEKIILDAVMKPIPSLKKPLNSVNIKTKEKIKAEIIRSDNCAVPAGAIVAENVCAIEIANAFLEKFGGDSLLEIERNYHNYIQYLRNY